jgi:hypothetical protein
MHRQLSMAAASSMKSYHESGHQRDERAECTEQQDIADIVTGDALPLPHVGNDGRLFMRYRFKVIA